MVVALGGERGADLLGHALDVADIQRAVAARRRADADEADVGRMDRLGDIGGRGQPAGTDGFGNDGVEAWLHDGGLAGKDRLHLAGVDIHRMHAVAVAREACCRDRAYVTDAENADPPHESAALPLSAEYRIDFR